MSYTVGWLDVCAERYLIGIFEESGCRGFLSDVRNAEQVEGKSNASQQTKTCRPIRRRAGEPESRRAGEPESRNSIFYDSYWGLSILRGLILLFALPFLCSSALADDPPFKPFVGVGIAEIEETYNSDLTKFTGTIVAGEALDVNSIGEVVGWVELGDGTTHGFYFSPILHEGDDFSNHTGRLIILDNPVGYAFAKVHAIRDSGNYDFAVGLAALTEAHYSQGHTDAVYWHLPNGVGTLIDDLNYPSAAYGVDFQYAVGAHRYETLSWGTSIMAMYFQNDDPLITELHTSDPYGSEGTAYDICALPSNNKYIVGAFRPDRQSNDYLHAYVWNENNFDDLNPSSGYEASSAYGLYHYEEDEEDDTYIVGWIGNEVKGKIFKYPTFWQNIEGGYGSWTYMPFEGCVTSSIAYDVNSHLEIVVGVDPEYGGNEAALWKRVDDGEGGYDDYGYELDDLVFLADLDPADDGYSALVRRAYAINDDGWIVGSYDPDGSGSEYEPMPLLCVPYNVNNNYYTDDQEELPYVPIPDYREIIAAGGPGNTVNDENYGGGREWLLDECEVMRSGMNDVGYDGSTKAGNGVIHIDKAQIVRQMWKDDHNGVFFLSDGDYDTDCQEGSGFLEYWGNGLWDTASDPEEGSDVDKEIVITYMHPDPEDPNYDCIPPDDEGCTREGFLRNLRHMAYGFPGCIDYIQFGNEHWAGNQMLRLYGFCGDGPYTLEEIYDDHNECFDDALAEVKSWYLDQIREARIGSALGGRPLRLFTSAIGRDVDVVAYQEDGGARAWMKFLIEEVANPYEASLDHQLHYQSVSEVSQRIDIVQSVGHSLWDAPVTTGSLEWGPVPDTEDEEGWYFNHRFEFQDYYEGGDDAPTEWTWNEFVRFWEDEQFDPTGFDFLGVLLDISNAGYLSACYGETLQRGSEAEVFPGDLSALRADKMEDIAFDQNNEWHFTTLRYDSFEVASGDTLIFIGSFIPHPLGCYCPYVCDYCNMN